MFNIGIGEMFIILLIALIVVGPERMPELARKLGGMIRDVRRMYDNLRGELGTDFDDVERAIRTLRSLDPRRELDAYGRKVISELAQDIGPDAETLLQSSPAQIKDSLKQQLALAPEGSVARGKEVGAAAAEPVAASMPPTPSIAPPTMATASSSSIEAASGATSPRRTSRVYTTPETPHAATNGNGAARKSRVYTGARQDAETQIARLGHDLLSDAALDRPVRESFVESASNGHGTG